MFSGLCQAGVRLPEERYMRGPCTRTGSARRLCRSRDLFSRQQGGRKRVRVVAQAADVLPRR